MYPTLQIDDHVFVSKIGSYGRGDLVVFVQPCVPRDYGKRIVAVANDTVEIRCRRMFLNGKPVAETLVLAKDISRSRPRRDLAPTRGQPYQQPTARRRRDLDEPDSPDHRFPLARAVVWLAPDFQSKPNSNSSGRDRRERARRAIHSATTSFHQATCSCAAPDRPGNRNRIRVVMGLGPGREHQGKGDGRDLAPIGRKARRWRISSSRRVAGQTSIRATVHETTADHAVHFEIIAGREQAPEVGPADSRSTLEQVRCRAGISTRRSASFQREPCSTYPDIW